MTDQKLLELAAKAAGELTPSWYGNDAYFDGVLMRWNPLTNDGDALRLAVKLSISISLQHSKHLFSTVTASARFDEIQCEEESKDYNYCSYAATRRAIVRAAAEIGKSM